MGHRLCHLTLLLASLCPHKLASQSSSPRPLAAPLYTTASIVNAASNLPGALAPYTIATIYGANLSYGEASITPEQIRTGSLPVSLTGAGVRVLVDNMPAGLYYVSPGQINFLIPGNLLPGKSKVQVLREGLAGPSVPIEISNSSPGIFQQDARTIVATHADGAPVTRQAPAQAGDVIVIYATGLGTTTPPMGATEIARSAAWITRRSDFQVTLNGVPLPPGSVLYAGLAPGFAGLYQVNVRLPAELEPVDQELRLVCNGQSSAPDVQLPLAQP